MKCPNCGKDFGYVRVSSSEWVCRACGKITQEDAGETKKETNEPTQSEEKDQSSEREEDDLDEYLEDVYDL